MTPTIASLLSAAAQTMAMTTTIAVHLACETPSASAQWRRTQHRQTRRRRPWQPAHPSTSGSAARQGGHLDQEEGRNVCCTARGYDHSQEMEKKEKTIWTGCGAKEKNKIPFGHDSERSICMGNEGVKGGFLSVVLAPTQDGASACDQRCRQRVHRRGQNHRSRGRRLQGGLFFRLGMSLAFNFFICGSCEFEKTFASPAPIAAQRRHNPVVSVCWDVWRGWELDGRDAQVATIHNLRFRMKRLTSGIRELALYGPMRPPEKRGYGAVWRQLFLVLCGASHAYRFFTLITHPYEQQRLGIG